MPTDDQSESLALQLTTNPNYRVLRRLLPCQAFAEPDGKPLLKGVIVDTETTRLNQDADKIIEIGIIVFEYDPETGQAYRVLDTYGCLEAGFPFG
jgi:DNA polymerase-3 subunit epsilon